MSSQNINLYLTSEHACGYLPNRMATNLVPDPAIPMSMDLYSQLIQLGYRRSGGHTYRPHCKSCQECMPCRIPVRLFTPNRNQRRCMQVNKDCEIRLVKACYQISHFDLYRRYINARHADGNMANPESEDYRQFLYSDWSDTLFLEIIEKGRLLAVAVCDRVDNGLSAVYSYFEPDLPARSLGTYCILEMIKQARSMGFDYLYLGYLIRDSRKMKYKQDFHPLEVFKDNVWGDMHASK